MCVGADLGVCFFFFQAEDGIRDLVRSRGLGDVYKRQLLSQLLLQLGAVLGDGGLGLIGRCGRLQVHALEPVSYTHLTLPTSALV